MSFWILTLRDHTPPPRLQQHTSGRRGGAGRGGAGPGRRGARGRPQQPPSPLRRTGRWKMAVGGSPQAAAALPRWPGCLVPLTHSLPAWAEARAELLGSGGEMAAGLRREGGLGSARSCRCLFATGLGRRLRGLGPGRLVLPRAEPRSCPR